MSAEIADKSTGGIPEEIPQYISEGSLENFLKESLEELLSTEIPSKGFSEKKILIQFPVRNPKIPYLLLGEIICRENKKPCWNS